MGEYDVEVKEVQPTIWVYRDPKDGSIKEREQTKEEREEQTVPPRGEYQFRIKAFAKKFEMKRDEKYGGGMQTMTRLLLEVVDGPSSKLKGQLTTALCTLSLSSNSNLGRVYMKATGKSLVPGTSPSMTELLEKEFRVYAKQDKLDDNGNRKSTVLSWDTVERADGDGEGEEEEEFEV